MLLDIVLLSTNMRFLGRLCTGNKHFLEISKSGPRDVCKTARQVFCLTAHKLSLADIWGLLSWYAQIYSKKGMNRSCKNVVS